MSNSVQNTEMGKGLVPTGTVPNKKYEVAVTIPKVTGGAIGDAAPATPAESVGLSGGRINDGSFEIYDGTDWVPVAADAGPTAPAYSGGLVNTCTAFPDGVYYVEFLGASPGIRVPQMVLINSKSKFCLSNTTGTNVPAVSNPIANPFRASAHSNACSKIKGYYYVAKM